MSNIYLTEGRRLLTPGLSAAENVSQDLFFLGPEIQEIFATGISSAEALGSPAISATASISATGVPGSEAFGTAYFVYDKFATAIGVPSSEAFGSPTITATASILAAGATSSEAFGSPTIAATASILSTGIPSSEAFGGPTVEATASIQATGISSTEAFGSPDVIANIVILNVSPGRNKYSLFQFPPQKIGAQSLTNISRFGQPSFSGSYEIAVVAIVNDNEAFGNPIFIKEAPPLSQSTVNTIKHRTISTLRPSKTGSTISVG